MTFVYSEIVNGEIWVVSDTYYKEKNYEGLRNKRVIRGEESRGQYFLKIFFFGPLHAIAIAGKREPAFAFIQHAYSIYRGTSAPFELEVSKAYRKFNPAGNVADFEIMFLSVEGDWPTIKVFTDIHRPFEGRFFIGDGNIYKAIPSEIKRKRSDFAQFQKIVNYLEDLSDRQEQSIGGRLIVSRGRHSGFKHIPVMRAVSPKVSISPFSLGWQSIDFGNAKSGGYGFTSIAPKKEGINGYGTYYFQGSYGEYFFSDLVKNKNEVIFLRGPFSKFLETLQQDMGYELDYCGVLGQ